jgi:CheY-like chemotaxis protein
MATILVVEDDEDMRGLLGMVLEVAGYRPRLVSNGHDALQVIEGDHPVLILLDLMMPVMDGWTLCRLLRDRPDTAQIPVVILSAHHAVATEACALGVAGWLTKPFDLDCVLHTVRQYLPT